MIFMRIALAIMFVATVGAGQIMAQAEQKPDVVKGVSWSDSGSGVEVYLVPKGGQTYRLAVISAKDVGVTYRTSINSTEPVVRELKPVATTGGVIRYYEFQHYFSKMTIWMSLEFTIEGKPTPALTRAFYDNMFQLAPGNMYFGPRS